MTDRRQVIGAAGGTLAWLWLGAWVRAVQRGAKSPCAGLEGSASAVPFVCVVGVGSGACDIVARVRRERIAGVDRTILIDRSAVPRQLDVRLDSGVDCELSVVDAAAVRDAVYGANTVFLVAGLGGATGTRIAPVVARAARAAGAATVSLLILPFGFEGKRCEVAARGARLVAQFSDRTIGFSNEERFKRERDLSVTTFYAKMTNDVLLCVRAEVSESVAS